MKLVGKIIWVGALLYLSVILGLADGQAAVPHWPKGSLSTKKHEVSGDVFFMNGDGGTRIKIKFFNYNGKGPDAAFYVGFETNKIGSSGVKIMYPKKLGRYNKQDVTVKLPKGYFNRDVKWLAVWSKKFRENYGSIGFTQDIYKGALSTKKHKVTGDVFLLDGEYGWRVAIYDFNYDGLGENAFIYVGFQGGQIGHEGTRINFPDPNEVKPLGKYKLQNIEFRLPQGKRNRDIDWISIWSAQAKEDYGNVFSGYDEYIGNLVTKKHNVSGRVHFVRRTYTRDVTIRDFFYTGKGKEAFFYVGFEDHTVGKNGIRINYPHEIGDDVLGVYDEGISVTFSVPSGYHNTDLKWISVWSRSDEKDYGSIVFKDEYKYIGDLNTKEHGVSGEIYFVKGNSGTEVAIKDFSYDGLGDDAYIYVGFTSGKIGNKGVLINYPNPKVNKKLGKYTKTEIKFALPKGYFNANLIWISIRSKSKKKDYGSYSFIYDQHVGELEGQKHKVNGDVYFLGRENGRKIRIRNFNYDGKGSNAYIYLGYEDDEISTAKGIRIDYPNPKFQRKLGKYKLATITFKLPGKSYNKNVKWMSILSRVDNEDYGSIKFKDTVPPAKPVKKPTKKPKVKKVKKKKN